MDVIRLGNSWSLNAIDPFVYPYNIEALVLLGNGFNSGDILSGLHHISMVHAFIVWFGSQQQTKINDSNNK